MERLAPAEKHYAWGSRTAIPAICGTPPSDVPIAELWFGAHPGGPSTVVSDSGSDGARPTTLLDLIDADPTDALGDRVAERYGGRLPFLLKVLAAAEPLSLQLHPTVDEAAVGFDRENEAGIAIDDPRRCFRDPVHKPEQVVAIDDFEALIGFRAPASTAELFDELAAPELASTATALEAGLDSALRHALEVDPAVVSSLAARLDELDGRIDGEWAPTVGTLARIARRHPTDPGIIVAAMLNRVELHAGQSVFLGPGLLHSYVKGTVVEIMANSDNVLRAGLTEKHVDVDAVLGVVDAEPLTPAVEDGRPGEYVYECQADEFSLTRLDGTVTTRRPGGGPEIVACVSDSAVVSDGARQIELRGGEAVWLPASTEGATIATNGQAFVASVGRS